MDRGMTTRPKGAGVPPAAPILRNEELAQRRGGAEEGKRWGCFRFSVFRRFHSAFSAALREIFSPFPVRASISICALLLLASCASRQPGFRDQPDYSTAYLGPNGEILFAARKGPKKPAEAPAPPELKWTWSGDDVHGAPSIVIDLSEQKARFYKGETEIGCAPVSTGREGYDTPAGNFSVIEKERNHISTLYGDYVNSSGDVVVRNVGVNVDKRPPGTRFAGAPMPFFLRVNGAVGMHAGYLPGYAASHGCIRLPRGAAEKFYENAPSGTPVRIVR